MQPGARLSAGGNKNNPPPATQIRILFCLDEDIICLVYRGSMTVVTPPLAQNNKYTRPPNADVLSPTITSNF